VRKRAGVVLKNVRTCGNEKGTARTKSIRAGKRIIGKSVFRGMRITGRRKKEWKTDQNEKSKRTIIKLSKGKCKRGHELRVYISLG